MAFLPELQGLASFHFDDENGGQVLDVAGVVAAAPGDAQLYCCGPTPMLDAFEAAKEIAALVDAGDDFKTWGEAGRIAVNVETVYRTLDPSHHSPDVVEQFRRMAALDH